jgi:hypothetical protein
VNQVREYLVKMGFEVPPIPEKYRSENL